MPYFARDVRPLLLLLLDPSVRVHTTLIAISRLKLTESGRCDAGFAWNKGALSGRFCSGKHTT